MNIIKLELRSKSIADKIQLGTTHKNAMASAENLVTYPIAGRKPTDAQMLAGQTALADSVTAVKDAETAWKNKIKLRDLADAANDQLLTARANDCEATTPDNEAALSGVGFPLRSAPTPTPALIAPQNVRASLGDQEGQMDLMWDAQKGAVSNRVQYKKHLSNEEWTDAEITPRSSITIAGLTPGENYAFRVRAVGKDGEGPWSDETVKRAS